MTNQLKLAIGIPAYTGQITAFAFRMWLDLGAMLRASEARFKLVQTNLVEVCGVDVARNKLVADALEVGADWLLMVDADTWFEDGSSILQMISDADHACFPNDQRHLPRGQRYRTNPNGDKSMVPLIGAVAAQVPKRDPDDTHLMVYEYVNGERQPFKIENQAGLTEIHAAATAMMAVNLNFIRHTGMKPPWFKFVWNDGDIKPFQGEDLYFCKRIRLKGGCIMGDGRFIAKHLQRPQVIKK